MRIVVHLKPDVASRLQRRSRSTKASRELKRAEQELGVRIEPMHPGVDDPDLQVYYTLEVPSHEQADKVVSTLRNLSAVDGVYIKPDDALP